MSGKISNAWELMAASWQILKDDKTLLFFPLISVICLLILLISFLFPLVHYLNIHHQVGNSLASSQTPSKAGVGYGLLFFCVITLYIS